MKEFQLLVEAVEKAQQRGVYSLQEVQMILNAIGIVNGELQKLKAEEQESAPEMKVKK